MATNLGGMFIQGGLVMWPLLVLSIISWAVILERIYTYLTLGSKLSKVGQVVLQALKAGDVTNARQICHQYSPGVGEYFLATVDGKKNREQSERIAERNRVRIAGLLKRNLWILGTIGSASPFIGLLGTVVGIIRSFHHMSQQGTGGFGVVSAGISEALIATAAGLVVAIVALLFYNAFTTVANQKLTQVKLSLDELMDEVLSQGKASI